MLSLLLVCERGFSLLQPVKGLRRRRVLGLVRMDEERFLAIGYLDIGIGDTRLEVKYSISVPSVSLSLRAVSFNLRIEFKGFQYAVNFSILYVSISRDLEKV